MVSREGASIPGELSARPICRDAPDADGIRGRLHPQGVHLPVCQLLRLAGVHRLLQGQVGVTLLTCHLSPGQVGGSPSQLVTSLPGSALPHSVWCAQGGGRWVREGWFGTSLCFSQARPQGGRERDDTQNLVPHSLTTWTLLGLWDTQATTTPCLESETKR